jgi:hypothetical protein
MRGKIKLKKFWTGRNGYFDTAKATFYFFTLILLVKSAFSGNSIWIYVIPPVTEIDVQILAVLAMGYGVRSHQKKDDELHTEEIK